MNLNGIPEELKKLNRWVVWKADKHPRNAITGEHASTGDPSTWCSWDEAVVAIKAKRAIGPGFVFSDEDDIVGIDLDKVIDEDGKLAPEADEIIRKIGSYTEVSKSGRGIHIICRGKKPGSRCRRDNVEVYDRGRYFAMTGDIYEAFGLDSVVLSQKGLDWVYSDVMEGSTQKGPEISVTLNEDAELPERAKDLLDNKEFKNTLLCKGDLPSLSDYDWKLASMAVEDGWADQEIADLIIAFRREHGEEGDLEKALREDYIPRTISKARASRAEGNIKLLPFKVRRVIQYASHESEYDIELDDGTKICIGTAECLLSASKAEARIFDAGYVLDNKAVLRWKKIVKELMPLVERVQTVTREESAKAWIDDFVNSRVSMPLLNEKNIAQIFGSGLHDSAYDDKGRLYLRLTDITRFARNKSGLGNMNARTVSHDLVNLGFSKHKVYLTASEGRRRQVSLWVSPVGFLERSQG